MTPTEQNYGLFELCKQVYEATGWENGGLLYEFSVNAASGSNVVFPAGKTPNAYPYDNTVYPLYTSDYLLEKLPFEEYDLFLATNSGVGWWIESFDNEFNIPRVDADTPLQALLKLTLKLHEEGRL